jgi:hypothetical protein
MVLFSGWKKIIPYKKMGYYEAKAGGTQFWIFLHPIEQQQIEFSIQGFLIVICYLTDANA